MGPDGKWQKNLRCFVQIVDNFDQLQSEEMVQLTTEQRVFVVLVVHNRTYSLVVAVQNTFRERFPDRNPPAQTTILHPPNVNCLLCK